MTQNSKQLFIFDLDGTLAKSKEAMDPEMAQLLIKLIKDKKVAVISGGGYPQFQNQFLRSLPQGAENLSNLYLLPTSGTRMYVWQGNWVEKYAETMVPKEKEKIMYAINSALKAAGYTKPVKVYGDVIEDRGSQVTFSALGQCAPFDEKCKWDPDREKRTQIAELLKTKIPEFDVRIGGSTSIDITRRGINKAYGIRKLQDVLGIETDAIVFVGDALYFGGNDYPAKSTGVDCVQVGGPEDTKKLIQSWVA